MTAEEVVRRLNGNWWNGQALARCPVNGHGRGRGDLSPSLSIAVGNNGRVLLHCFAGCRTQDVFAALQSGSPSVAGAPQATRAAAPPRRSSTAAAQALWNAACPVKGTAAEAYLHSRGLQAESDALRFLPTARHPNTGGPGLSAMLAAILGPDDVLVALQRTFLTRAGAKAAVNPARMMLGRLGSGAVRLAPAASPLGLAEGVETALAASQLHGIPCWAACGARMERIALPDGVRDVILFADNDQPGLTTADRAARRFRAEGRHVDIRAPQTRGADWADILLAAGAISS